MPNLETLELSSLKPSKKTWDGKLPVHFYNRNFSLTVNDCHSLKSLFSSSTVRALDKLLRLQILRCRGLRQIFVYNEEITFPELETLLINNVNLLKSIWPNQQDPDSFSNLKKIEINKRDALLYVFPIVVAKKLRQLQVLKIEKLIVYECAKLKTIFQSSVLFQTLYELEVSYCAQVINIMMPLTATCLESLHILNISEYPMLEQLFDENIEGDELRAFTFRKLEKLELKGLPWLTNFCKKSYNFNFPSLRSVHVVRCPKMNNFVRRKGQKYDDSLFAMFKEQVAMPNLEILELNDIGSQKIWDDKLPVQFYSQNMRNLTMIGCDGLVSLFSPSATRALAKLQYLEISHCKGLVEIFVQQEAVTFPNLETLIICDLYSLKSIWNNQQAPNSFCNLKILQINNCGSLHHVLPIVVAKELPQLQELKILWCRNIENIVEKSYSRDAHDGVASTKLDELKFGSENKGDALGNVASMNLEELKYKADELDEIVFMKLEKLELEMLPRLTSFCNASYNFKFPALQTIRVIKCTNMKTFSNGYVITASLPKVQYSISIRGKEEDHWDGDLNTTLERETRRMSLH